MRGKLTAYQYLHQNTCYLALMSAWDHIQVQKRRTAKISTHSVNTGAGAGGAGPAIAGPILKKKIIIIKIQHKEVLGNVSCCEYKTQHTYMCMYAHA